MYGMWRFLRTGVHWVMLLPILSMVSFQFSRSSQCGVPPVKRQKTRKYIYCRYRPTQQSIFEAEIQLPSLTWFDLIYYSLIPRKHERWEIVEWLRSPPRICNAFHACQFAIICFYRTLFLVQVYQWKYFIIGCGWLSLLNAHSIM